MVNKWQDIAKGVVVVGLGYDSFDGTPHIKGLDKCSQWYSGGIAVPNKSIK